MNREAGTTTEIALDGSIERVFPSLSDSQIERVAAHGTRRYAQAGEVLYEQGAPHVPFFVLISAELEAVRPTELGKRLVELRGRGQFTVRVPASKTTWGFQRGFPTGVSGQELAGRAFTQADKFGAELVIDRVTHLECARTPYSVRLESGANVPARTI